ncbi:MAG TPA: hypothetical protein VEV15_04850 [Flavisolibacter sp.]|nr:hypothetical protein [Flavisolibacter sp.]
MIEGVSFAQEKGNQFLRIQIAMILFGKKRLLASTFFFVGPNNRRKTTPSRRFIGFALVLYAAMCSSLSLYAQDEILIDGQECGMHGNAKSGEGYALNAYKNRYAAPKKADFDASVTLAALLRSGDPNQFSQDKAAVVHGYVYDVKPGGVESCNCKTSDPQFRDTHIEITPDENNTGPENRLIVEVTPRLRAAMQKKGVDWSTAALRQSIKGHWVEVAGWLTYDAEHETAAYANDPDDAIGQHNWRATVWEVHPITYLKVISKGDVSSLDAIVGEQGGTTDNNNGTGSTDGTKPSGGHSILLIMAVVLLALVAGYFLLKNKLH